MSSKMSRKSASTSSGTTRIPKAAATASRFKSSRVSRLQEKLQLQDLNDRLATYIDRVRFLEDENVRLSNQVEFNEETTTRQVTKIKSMYERELVDIRKVLDDTAREKACLQIELSKHQAELLEVTSKLEKRRKMSSDTEKDLMQCQSHIEDLQANINKLTAEKKRTEDYLKEAEGDRDKLSEELAVVSTHLEEVTVCKVDLLNKIQSMKEELSFKETVHQQELSESLISKQSEISDVNLDLQERYEQKLSDTLKEIRHEYESQMKINRKEKDTYYERKLSELQKRCDQYTSDTEKANEKLKTFRTKVDFFTSKADESESQNAVLKARVKALERLLEQERDQHGLEVKSKDDENAKLREVIEQQMCEYHDLLEIKVALDMEIASYRKMLETEEDRLNISTSEVRRSTPRKTPVDAKRKRTTVHTEGMSNLDVQSSASARGDIKIIDCDLEGKYIKLFNEGNVDVPVGNFKIIQRASENETVYQFHRSLIVKEHSSVTIWSSDAGVIHNPPTDLVMKGRTWFASENMSTILLNNNGEVMSLKETFKGVHIIEPDVQVSEELYHQQGDPANVRDRCAIM